MYLMLGYKKQNKSKTNTMITQRKLTLLLWCHRINSGGSVENLTRHVRLRVDPRSRYIGSPTPDNSVVGTEMKNRIVLRYIKK